MLEPDDEWSIGSSPTKSLFDGQVSFLALVRILWRLVKSKKAECSIGVANTTLNRYKPWAGYANFALSGQSRGDIGQ